MEINEKPRRKNSAWYLNEFDKPRVSEIFTRKPYSAERDLIPAAKIREKKEKRKQYDARYYAKNREELVEKHRKWVKEHRETVNKAQRKYREKNAEKCNQWCRDYYRRHAEEIKAKQREKYWRDK